LNAPRDILAFDTVETAASAASSLTAPDAATPFEYWRHYLIADSGNQRLVEIVDRLAYDPTTGTLGSAVTVGGVPQVGMLLWHSPGNLSGKNFDYVSISRVFVPNVPLTSPVTGRYVYVAGIGSSLPSSVDLGVGQLDGTTTQLRESAGGNGGVVVFDPLSISGAQVINALDVPAIGAGVFFNEATRLFDSAAQPARTIYPGGTSAADRRMKLTGVQSVTARPALDPGTGGPSVAIMVAEATGVYEFNYTLLNTGAVSTPTVGWMLPGTVYKVLRRVASSEARLAKNPQQFRPTFAKRLSSGEVLVVNGYVGYTRGNEAVNGTGGFVFTNQSQFSGEVLQLDGSWNAGRLLLRNLGFNSQSILFELPPISGTRGIVSPVFADRS
jgi:hypothetical protein